MHRRTNPKTLSFARELRHNPTEAEARLWQVLWMHNLGGVRFRRQHAIGPFVAEFAAPLQKIIIEVDGEQHLGQQEYDGKRTAFLESRGYRVLRFWNDEVMNNRDEVLRVILAAIMS